MATRTPPTRPCPHCGDEFDSTKHLCPHCRRLVASEHGEKELLALAPCLADLGDAVEVRRLVAGPWDPCFGGGIATTGVTLLGAEAGAGKTTLSLQICDAIARTFQRKVLFIAVEMVDREVRAYAQRFGLTEFSNIHVMSLVQDLQPLSRLEQLIAALKPALVVLDSVSKLSKGDHASEVVMCSRAKRLASKYEAPWIIISHINKEGAIAGKQAMQHDVDTLLSFHIEPDGTRVLECPTKNRFGKTPAFVAFSMTDGGLVPRAMPQRTPPDAVAAGADDEAEEENAEEETEDPALEESDSDESERSPFLAVEPPATF